jgi:GNAT superfamily N-acetyltransferase
MPLESINIRRCTVAEILAEPTLLAAHADENSLVELGSADPQPAMYAALEAVGAVHPFGAFEGERLVGFIVPVLAPLPHYGLKSATVESWYVLPEYRDAGLGLHLLAAAREAVRELGARTLFVVAQTGSPLSVLMSKWTRYRHCNDVYVEPLTP